MALLALFMLELPSLRPETRYGVPGGCDLLLFNRHYIAGYSYLFRQSRWAVQLIDSETQPVHTSREDYFRVDPRVPPKFRSELSDYSNSGYDRGHLVNSGDRLHTEIANSETFLLSNMSPQIGVGFNRGVWKDLEESIRIDLAAQSDALETYVVVGPVFELRKPIESIGNTLIPHSFFKSVLSVNRRGDLDHWSFLIPNEPTKLSFHSFQVETNQIESRVGLLLWDRITDPKFLREKERKKNPW